MFTNEFCAHQVTIPGNVMVASDVLDGSQGSAIEAVDRLCQGLPENPRFCSIEEKRNEL